MSVVKGVEVLLPLIARPASWITSMLLDPTPPHTQRARDPFGGQPN